MRFILMFAALGAILLVSSSLAVGEDLLPGDTILFVSDDQGNAYAVVQDTMFGFPILIPISGARAEGSFTSAAVRSDGLLFLADPCGGEVVRLTVPDLLAETVYSTLLFPAPDCTAEACNPFDGWLNPTSVAVAPEGDLIVLAAIGGCPHGDTDAEGLWRLRLGGSGGDDPVLTRIDVSLDAIDPLVSLDEHSVIVVPTDGPNEGRLVIAASGGTRAEILTVALDEEVPAPALYSPAGFSAARGIAVLPLRDGSVVWQDEAATVWWSSATAAVALFPVPADQRIVAADVDAGGSLYLALSSSRGGQLARFDPEGGIVGRLALSTRPTALAVWNCAPEAVGCLDGFVDGSR